MADPVSWLLVEPGWAVVDRDGNFLGEVREVVGDTTADIFDGLHVSGAEGDWYVAATRIGRIVEGEVEADPQTSGAAEPEAPPGGAELRRDRDVHRGGDLGV